jgi:hypothetical protein
MTSEPRWDSKIDWLIASEREKSDTMEGPRDAGRLHEGDRPTVPTGEGDEELCQHDKMAAAQLRIREKMEIDKRAMFKRQDDKRTTLNTHRAAFVNNYLLAKNEEFRPVVTAIAQIRAK